MNRKQLKHLQADYKKVFGKEMQHFHCPILLKDDNVELCDGHVLCEKFKMASRLKVIQRKDIDNYFGSAIEPDLITFFNAPMINFEDLIKSKRGTLKIILPDGTESELFFAGPAAAARFQQIELTKDGRTLASPFLRTGTVDGPQTDMQIRFDAIFHNNSLVGGMLKSAYLAMFRLFGYAWVNDRGAEKIRNALQACFEARKHPAKKEQSFFRNFAGSVRMLAQHPFKKDTLTGNVFLMHATPFLKREVMFAISCLFEINGTMIVVAIPSSMEGERFSRAFSTYERYIKNPAMQHICRVLEFDEDAFFASEKPLSIFQLSR